MSEIPDIPYRPSYVPIKAPVYHNNREFDNFNQPKSGFGFSNFRIESEIPPDILRSVSNDNNFEKMRNPAEEAFYERNSNFFFRQRYPDFKLIDETPAKEVPEDYIYLDIIQTLQERNPVLDYYFSKKNLDHMQNLVQRLVYEKSDGAYRISRQSDTELLTVMRSIYLTTPLNHWATGPAFKEEIAKLNKNVLDWVIPRLLVNIQQYLGFRRDQSDNILPIDRPAFNSSAGTKLYRGFDANFI